MRQHLERGLSEENRQMLLKESLQRITIEVSGHCNRTCHFCPNEAGSRIDEHRLMSDNVFDRILRNLVQIDYQGVILLHFYNEPLADLENTLIRIGQLRQALPSARISFNTNGDHLRRGVLDQLVDAGLTSLTVSIYGPNPGNWNPEALSSALDRVLARVLFERTQCIDEVVLGDGSVRLLFDYRELDITFLVEHLAETGYDRGGLLQIGKRDERSAPCLYPFSDVTVDYLGQVVPCCNVYPDREEHKGYVFATIGTDTEDLFSVYASDTATSWRQTLLAKGPYEAPCATCTRCDAPEDAVPYDGDPFPALIELSTIRSLERLTSVD
jgi:hypothetical protein